MADQAGYKNIFKTTFLFGFVQVARLLVSVVKNKITAILLGPAGLGIISIYNNMISLVKTGAGLGLYQSAVKDVSEANNSNDKKRFSYIISVTNRIVLFTSFFGLIITIALSPLLSLWGFGDNLHVIPFIFLSVAVALDIYVDNALSILKGMRHLRALAKATLIGSAVSLTTGVPLFYFFGISGIVPSIIISSLSAALVTCYFVSKIDYDKIKINWKESFRAASSMLKMGTSLMISNFLSYIFSMLVIGYIQDTGGIVDVGFYSAGNILVVSYFSMITTALNTDYYPRIAALSNQNEEIQEEVKKQSAVGIVLMAPAIIMFVLLIRYIIDILYTVEFLKVIQFTDIAVIGTLMSVISNCLGYVFLAKQESRLYIGTSIVLYTIYIPMYLLLYRYFGLVGLGISYTASIMLQLFVYWALCYKRYGITVSKSIMVESLLIILVVLISIKVRFIANTWIKYFIEILVIGLATVYTVVRLKSMDIDIIGIAKHRIWKK